MSNPPKHEILIVDDDPTVRNSLVMLLKSSGYAVSTATHGFDALLQLKRKVPPIVISDLNMPQMSGFELLSVLRRRFPQISVIAMSGAYDSGDAVPGGVIADAFYGKGQSSPEALLQIVADLIRTSAAHAVDHERQSAPVWIPRNGKDSNGISLRGIDLHGVLALISIERDDRGPPESPGNTLPVLPQYGQIYHRFFSFDSFPRIRTGTTSTAGLCDETSAES
jgi:CheY-like chemotaxis protein